MKKQNIVGWVLGAFVVILLITIMTSSNNGNSTPITVPATPPAVSSDYKFSNCLDRAKTDFTNNEITVCLNQGGTQDYCTYNHPNYVAGIVYENYQQDKNNCAAQFPGASYIVQNGG